MKARRTILLEKSKSAMLSAVEIINKPTFPYREEIFLILCSNAWELFIKAKWLAENKNRINSLYVKKNKQKKNGEKSKKLENKISRSGNPITHELNYLMKQLNKDKVTIEQNILENIELIVEARDSVIHFYTENFELLKKVRELALASLESYIYLSKKWFDIDLSEFGFSLLPISVINAPNIIKSHLSSEESNFINYLTKKTKTEDISSDRRIILELDIKLKRTNATGCNITQVAIDPNSKTKIALSEENMLEKYPLSNSELINILKEAYSNFKQDKKFNELKKEIKKDTNCSYKRKLNPKAKKSAITHFYNKENCSNFFDKHYDRKK